MNETIQDIRNLLARCKFNAAYQMCDQYDLEPRLIDGKIQIVDKSPTDIYSNDFYKLGGTA